MLIDTLVISFLAWAILVIASTLCRDAGAFKKSFGMVPHCVPNRTTSQLGIR